MTITLSDYLTTLRHKIGDDVSPSYYPDATVAEFALDGARAYSSKAIQQVSTSGSGTGATVSLDSSNQDELEIYFLYVKRETALREVSENSRRGYSVSNVAGRIDGRERFLSARDWLKTIEDDIRSLEHDRTQASIESQMVARDASRAESGSGWSELGG